MVDRIGASVSIHHVHAPEIVLTGSDNARGCWPMMDYVEFTARDDRAADRGWISWGCYEEEYRRIGGQWRISFMRLARQRMDTLTADHPALTAGRIAPDPDWL